MYALWVQGVASNYELRGKNYEAGQTAPDPSPFAKGVAAAWYGSLVSWVQGARRGRGSFKIEVSSFKPGSPKWDGTLE